MKQGSLKLAALLLALLTATSIVSAPRSADACTPEEYFRIDKNIDFGQTIPLNGAWAFRMMTHFMAPNFFRVEVRDDSDTPVDGSLTKLELRKDGYKSDWLIIWTPTELLLPERRYEVRLFSSHYDHETESEVETPLGEGTHFLTSASPETDPAVATLVGEPALQIAEIEGDQICCDDQTACECSGICRRCWPTRYLYLPAVEIEVQFPSSDTNLQTYHRIKHPLYSSDIYWNRSGVEPSRWIFHSDTEGPYCVTLQTFALATQELLSERETCLEHSDLPPYTERELEGVTRPETCESGPDTGEVPDAGEQPDTGGGADAGEQPDTGEQPERPEIGPNADDGCGCTATPNAPTSLLSMMLFFAMLGGSRLPHFSRRR